MTRPASILVVDDHPLAREGLMAVLERGGYAVVGAAANGEEALKLAAERAPDIVLMDIRLGDGIDGLEATRVIGELGLPSRVLMVTLHDSPDYVRAALDAGAAGYVLKDTGIEELRDAIDQVLAGHTAIPPTLVARALKRADRSGADPLAFARLTDREHEVLALVSEGCTNKEIARQLDISPATVKAHVERVISKLGVADRTQAAVLVARQGQAK